MHDIKAIPTVYNGRQYRSRLEARWAAFFDLVGWRYEYEPFDLPGWIPDFLLLGKAPVLVEVKPVMKFPKDVAGEIEKVVPKGYELLIVGCSLQIDPDDSDYERAFGWLYEDCGDEFGWDLAVLGRWRLGDGRIGFCSSEGGYGDRISGAYDGGSWGEDVFCMSEALKLWSRAGNLTQWRGKQSVVEN